MIEFHEIIFEWFKEDLSHFNISFGWAPEIYQVTCKCYSGEYTFGVVNSDVFTSTASFDDHPNHQILQSSDPEFFEKLKHLLIETHERLIGTPPYGPKPPHL